MHAIVQSNPSSFIHPIYWPQASNSAHHDVPLRLKSPFQLASGSQTHEIVSEGSSHGAQQRRRHCARVDCPVQPTSSSSSSHPFDDLPWISAMDSTSEQFGLVDIADLSQLPVSAESLSSRPGPVRRRKTSHHRTSPIRAVIGSSAHSTHHTSMMRSRYSPAPSTPRPRTPRSRIAFHDLMPLFTCDIRKYRGSNPSSPAY